jgi:hypothetical protein
VPIALAAPAGPPAPIVTAIDPFIVVYPVGAEYVFCVLTLNVPFVLAPPLAPAIIIKRRLPVPGIVAPAVLIGSAYQVPFFPKYTLFVAALYAMQSTSPATNAPNPVPPLRPPNAVPLYRYILGTLLYPPVLVSLHSPTSV